MRTIIHTCLSDAVGDGAHTRIFVEREGEEGETKARPHACRQYSTNASSSSSEMLVVQ